MCLIIHRIPNTLPISNEILGNASELNPDGIGVMTANGRIYKYANPDILKVEKLVRKLEKANEEFGIHFRMATHGRVSRANCHPVIITKYVSVMHNGILPDADFLSQNHRVTDTQGFCDLYADKILSSDFDFIKSKIGTNRLLIRQDFEFTRLGNWHEYEGCWYSNTHSLPYDQWRYWQDERSIYWPIKSASDYGSTKQKIRLLLEKLGFETWELDGLTESDLWKLLEDEIDAVAYDRIGYFYGGDKK